MEEDLIIELWDLFKEYVPEKNREDAASHYVDFLSGKDVNLSTLEALTGFDPHLDSAINLLIQDAEEEEDSDEEDDYDYEEDYED